MTARQVKTPDGWQELPGRPMSKNDAIRALLTRVETLEAALTAASEDARILVQDYYSGLPEHRAPVDGAVARLCHLFERDNENCEPRTVDEIVTEGIAARAALRERPSDAALVEARAMFEAGAWFAYKRNGGTIRAGMDEAFSEALAAARPDAEPTPALAPAEGDG